MFSVTANFGQFEMRSFILESQLLSSADFTTTSFLIIDRLNSHIDFLLGSFVLIRNFPDNASCLWEDQVWIVYYDVLWLASFSLLAFLDFLDRICHVFQALCHHESVS